MGKKQIKVLLIEDHEAYAQLLCQVLAQEENPPFHIETATTLKSGLERSAKGGIDLILLDLSLPDSQGLDTFDRVQSQLPDLPIIVLTALDDQRIAIDIVRKGAQDYLVKGKTDGGLLARIIRHAIERKHAERTSRRSQAQTGQLLSSLTSILIGLSSDGLISHWNSVAETTFGIPASEVIGQPLSKCGVRWNSERILGPLEECLKNNRPLRLDDIRFKHSDGQERLLGFTLIPITGETEGTIEFLLFGADITSRRQVDQMKNEFVSTVSHEFRTPLSIIKEGVSQILDGICGPTTPPQKQTLSFCLEAIARLEHIVAELLDISKIESGKMPFRRERVNIVELAKKVCSTFEGQARKKGLALKLKTSKDVIEISVDEGKIVQVFTNLLGNALKFTEKGYLEVSVMDKENGIECCVADTGKGIAKADLPKVFSKFEQFAREAGPGAQGTGLGLAICKGLVEVHQGKIEVESELGKGTRITFFLPYLAPKKLLQESVSQQLEESEKYGTSLSIAVFGLKRRQGLQKKMDQGEFVSLTQQLGQWVKNNLRRKEDVTYEDENAVFVLLPATGKPEALTIASRIQEVYDHNLASQSLDQKVQLTHKVVSFPEDGRTKEILLNQLGGTHE